ncbi:diisopropyl-fluorophosphatase [Plakobranchus ocellatus]|uniref:Diisopropyl-fluorophosphatase n=1 Tax=Plakobranchus ocellatus TaxID=259542 RepID=A0AAV3ZRY9_9GAST|nr:diisopropyl-fluorophosphatase [Plakobranchus ocellatus]
MAVVSLNFSKIVDNLLGAEGPVFDSKGNFFMVAPEVEKEGKAAGQILKVDLVSKQAEVICEPNIDGYGGMPAGCQADKNGNLYVADLRLGILTVKPDGKYTQIAKTDAGGRTLQGCNDCAFDYHGNLWFSAPASDIAPSPYLLSFEEPFGSIYCLTVDGLMIHLDSNFRFSNGLAVKHSKGKPEKLIVAETATRILWSYNIDGPGKVSSRKEWAKLPDPGCQSGPDGMDFDEQGNLLVAHWGAGVIEVFCPDGKDPVKRIQCPFDKPSNLHFKPGSNIVYVTEHTHHGLWQFEWECKGMPQFCET